jgi:hypothetical protein
MPSYVVSYDLHQHGQNYQCLIEKLRSYPTHWHMQQSVWIIVSNNSAEQIRDHLIPCLDANDKLFVGRLAGEAAWYGYTDQISQWLQKFLRA